MMKKALYYLIYFYIGILHHNSFAMMSNSDFFTLDNLQNYLKDNDKIKRTCGSIKSKLENYVLKIPENLKIDQLTWDQITKKEWDKIRSDKALRFQYYLGYNKNNLYDLENSIINFLKKNIKIQVF